jgi:hypothetical protein
MQSLARPPTDVMYGVWIMQRTNIYLSDPQLQTLRRLGEQRGVPVAELVRQAVDAWLRSQGVRSVPEDEWDQRFRGLLLRRSRAAKGRSAGEADVQRDVALAVKEARRAKAARRH